MAYLPLLLHHPVFSPLATYAAAAPPHFSSSICSRKSLILRDSSCSQIVSLKQLAKNRHWVLASSPNSSPSSEIDDDTPIPGAVTFRRSATQTHFEFFTDLHTLGLRKLSSESSKSVALSMGIQTSSQEVSSTPVAVSIDVSNEGRDLRLEGIVRTAMALRCNRCTAPVAERIFAEFSLLLTEQPVVEPSQQRIGVVLGADKGALLPDEEVDAVLDLDLDDKLHFPKTQKSIDLSKYIRDTVHLEIPLQCLCALSCRGICVDCGTNLNINVCKCQGKVSKQERRAIWAPLEQLKKKMEEET